MSTHYGRSFVGHRLEDECGCPQEACGLVSDVNVSSSCAEHPISAMKAIRQSHDSSECPALHLTVGKLVYQAAEDFFSKLDAIATREGLDSKVFLNLIDRTVGEIPQYDEWVQGTWEFVKEEKN